MSGPPQPGAAPGGRPWTQTDVLPIPGQKTHRGRGAASEEGHTVPGGYENPGGGEVQELREVSPDILCGSAQCGWVSGLPVVHITCTSIVHICPEGCHYAAVLGDGKCHWGELRDLLQEGDDPIIVHLSESQRGDQWAPRGGRWA